MYFKTGALFVTFIATVCAYNNNLNDLIFSGDYEFIDLTHPFNDETVYWPNSQNFVFTRKIEEQNDDGWYAANDFAAGEHGGTHIDAPYHFSRRGQQVGDLPLEKLIVPMIIADVSSMVNDDPNFILYKYHLDNLINNNMGKPMVIVFKFGWSKFFTDRTKYLGLEHNNINQLNFPGISEEVVEWITSSYKNIVGIGVDVPSIDPGSNKMFPANKLCARSGVYILKNVNFHRTVPDNGCTALVLPMKIAQGSGAPLRLVAICPKKK